MKDVGETIKTFKGAKRRFKEKVIGDVITIDDYAHHPTEVRVTLEAVRQKYPNKELVAVFLENTYSRTKMLYKDFADALNIADKAYVTDIFSDRESIEDYKDVSPMLIVDRLNNGEHLKIGSVENLIDINYTECINPLLKHKNAVIVFMGCKEVYDIKEKLEKVLGEYMTVLDGEKIKLEKFEELKREISKLDRKPGIVVIQVGDDENSNIYVKSKEKAALELGCNFEHIKYGKDVVK